MILDFRKLDFIQTKQLNKVADEIRNNFVDLVDNLYENREADLSWLFSAIASKDFYLTSLFEETSRIKFADEYVSQNNNIQEIIVYNKGTYSVLKQMFAGKQITVTFAGRFFEPYIEMVKIIVSMLVSAVISYIFIRKKKSGMAHQFKNITILDTFILENSFTGDTYIDRWYVELQSSIRNTYYYLPTFSVSPFIRIRLSKKASKDKRFIFQEDFLKISDYFKAIYRTIFSQKIQFKDLVLDHINLSDLFLHEQSKSRINLSTYQAYITYFSIFRFVESGNSISVLIDWNENQLIDKALNKAIKSFSPQTITVGYRGYIVSPQFIHMIPTPAEKRAGLLPSVYAVPGKKLVETVNEFDTTLDVKVAPFFRSLGVHIEKISSPQGYQIMLALPIDLNLSKMLIENINYVVKKSKTKFQVVIKPHSNYTEAAIRAICPDINVEFLFAEEDFNTTLEKSNLMITSMSTSAMESMAKGVPVVLACQNSELYKIPIPKSIQQEIWRLTTNPDEMLKAISELLSLDRTFVEEKAHTIRGDYFENISDLSVELLVCGYKGVQ